MSADKLVCINLHKCHHYAKTPPFTSFRFSIVQLKIVCVLYCLNQTSKMMSMWQPFGVSHLPRGTADLFFADPFEVGARATAGADTTYADRFSDAAHDRLERNASMR
jgi:hypothetical protein